ncbi:MAG: hypothetical protein OXF24_05765, partial [Hyphomicrobiales bacterium]|nr:hypothetical protein [Hyphomicrobiales bacterium]
MRQIARFSLLVACSVMTAGIDGVFAQTNILSGANARTVGSDIPGGGFVRAVESTGTQLPVRLPSAPVEPNETAAVPGNKPGDSPTPRAQSSPGSGGDAFGTASILRQSQERGSTVDPPPQVARHDTSGSDVQTGLVRHTADTDPPGSNIDLSSLELSNNLSTASGESSARATGTSSTMAEQDAQATGAGATALGQISLAAGVNTTTPGQDARTRGADSTATGQASIAETANNPDNSAEDDVATRATAAEQNARTTGQNATATGQPARATGTDAAAVGQNARALFEGAAAIGKNALANKADTTAIGETSQATGDH